MTAPRLLFVQRLEPERTRERVVDERFAPMQAEFATPWTYLRPPSGVFASGAALALRSLRWSAMALWLSPLLILPKLVTNFVDPRLSDGLTLLFLAIVLSFFLSLIAFIACRLITGSVEEMRHGLTAPGDAPLPPRRVEALPPASVSGAPRADDLRRLEGRRVTLRGEITSTSGELGSELLRDFWIAEGDGYLRWLDTVELYLDAGEVGATFEFHSAPAVVAATREWSAHDGYLMLPVEARRFVADPEPEAWARGDGVGQLLTLRAGDSVEVSGVVARVTDDPNDQKHGPTDVGYRERARAGRAALVFQSSREEPVILRRVGR